MKNRFYSSIVLLVILAATVVLDLSFEVEWFSSTLITMVVIMGALECYRLFRVQERRQSPEGEHGGPARIGQAALAVVCIGLPGGLLLALRLQERGLLLVLYLVTTAKMVDNGALFVGRMWGRHKLAPKISPAKTVEGVCGGLFTGMLSSVILGPFCAGGSLLFSLVFGLAIAVLAIVGDLAVSFIKRRAGVKDSGSLLPGIGGILDLMDSVLLSAPVGYLLLAPWIAG